MKMDSIKIKNGIIALLILFSVNGIISAQTGSIEGIATDKKNKETLPGVMITIEGTTFGASADFNGHFIITRGFKSNRL